MALTDDEIKEIDRAPLRGLQGVNVIVEGLQPEMEEAGITKKAIQTKVELRLRTLGIKVLSETERLQTPGRPYLYLNLNSVFYKNDIGQLIRCSYSLELSLHEIVLLKRDKSKECDAAIWDKGFCGSVGIRYIDEIYDSILNFVDTFCNDYLAANPPVAKSGTISGADAARFLDEPSPQEQKNQSDKEPQKNLPSNVAGEKPRESQVSTQPTTQPAS